MNEIIKVTAIGIAGAITAMTVGQYQREFGILTGLITALVIFSYAAQWLYGVMEGLREIVSETGIEIKYFTSVLKVVGVAYITQFGSEILKDSGENAIALKLELAGKIFIMSLTLPIISDFLYACIEAVKMI